MQWTFQTEVALMFDAVYAYARGIDNASRLLFDENPSVKARCEPYGPYQAHPLGSTFFNYISHAVRILMNQAYRDSDMSPFADRTR